MRSKNSSPVISFSGKVYAQSGRGKGLGFPTANIQLKSKIEHGIYVSRTKIGENWHPSVTFVGVPKTFSAETQERAETHILKGEFELVGRELVVELLKFLRPNKKFASIVELTKAIQDDVAEAKAYFAPDNFPTSPGNNRSTVSTKTLV